MKKKIKYILIILILVSLIGCDKKDQQKQLIFGNVSVYSSTSDHFFNDQSTSDTWQDISSDSTRIIVNDMTTYQEYKGVGAALTSSSAYLIYHSPSRDEILTYLFSKDEGLGLNLIRLPMGSSDFVGPNSNGIKEHYTYDDMPIGQTDENLDSFSIDHDMEYIIPILKEALQYNPNIKIFAVPWSAPAWMKTSKSLFGGELSWNYMSVYAEYFVKFIQAYQEQGINIDTVSIQNEPMHEAYDYPSMKMNASTTIELVRQIGELFKQNEIDTHIMVWDHNVLDNANNLNQEPFKILENEGALNYINSIGVHCYVDPPNSAIYAFLDKVKNEYENIDIYMSECTEILGMQDFITNVVWANDKNYLQAFNHGNNGTMYWNIALDNEGNPHLGGCSNCSGLVTIGENDFTPMSIAAISGQYSKYIHVGAKRIEIIENEISLEVTGFKYDNTISLVIVNKAGLEQKANIEWEGKEYIVYVPARSMSTITWERNYES